MTFGVNRCSQFLSIAVSRDPTTLADLLSHDLASAASKKRPDTLSCAQNCLRITTGRAGKIIGRKNVFAAAEAGVRHLLLFVFCV